MLLSQGGPIILLSFIIAAILHVLPMPDWVRYLWPQWLVLVLIYWIIALPHRVGIASAVMLGLFKDVLDGAVLGQNAFSLAVIAYLALLLHRRIRVFPWFQQALCMLLLVALYQLLNRWLQGVLGNLPLHPWWYWLSSVMSALIWPYLAALLRYVRLVFLIV
jgi:rod shape-determining protein MreD